MPSWPSLPGAMERAGYTVSPPVLVREAPRSRGKSRLRRIFRRGAWKVSGAFRFDDTDLATFEAFFAETLRSGELSFDGLARPHDGAVGRARFNAENGYELARAAGETRVSVEDMEFWAEPTDPGGLGKAWPSINPAMLAEGYAIGAAPGAIRGAMAGFQGQRGVSRAVPQRVTGVFRFTDAEYALFEQWFVHGLGYGALAVTGWPRPHDGASGQARFDAAEPWTALRTAGGWRVAANIDFIED
ncbi:hypothetical protein [Hyphobacterium sp.]|uniref:hypothetical protein n=1 Tax=Hyphobacterium sp. TaxID=2004662 RepID=UPI003B52516B